MGIKIEYGDKKKVVGLEPGEMIPRYVWHFVVPMTGKTIKIKIGKPIR